MTDGVNNYNTMTAAAGSGLNNPATGSNFIRVVGEINRNHRHAVLSLALLDDNDENPRGLISEDDPDFAELVASIDAEGLLEPVPVTPVAGGRYRLIGGHRRKKATVWLGWTEISCTIVENLSKSQEIILMLAENIHRNDLTYCQQARGFARLLQEGKNVFQVARALKVSKSQIDSRLPLIKLTPEAQSMVDCGDLLLGHGAQLARLPFEDQNTYAVRAQRMSVKKFEKLVGELLNSEISEAEVRVRSRKRQSSYKVLGEDEQFTRSQVIKSLSDTKEKSFSAEDLRAALDDVCQDACIEERSELACMGCPVPRLVASLLKRTNKAEDQPK